TLPPGELADRYPGPVTGVLGGAGLRDPDELVAVVGRPAGDPVLTAPGTSAVVAVAAFDRPAGADTDAAIQAEIYRQLTIVAAALVLFPAAGLIGASARLSAARRGERLATLRLLGASTSRITVVAVTEVTVAAAAGALAGIALEWLAAPALATIPLAGGGWFAADVRPSPSTRVVVLVAITLLATASAVGGLRRVVISPLGVVRRRDPQVVRGLRLLGPVAAVVVFGVANAYRQASPIAAAGPVFAVGVLALFGAVSVVGPLVVRGVGAAMAGRARAPHRLLAGRRLLDDPKGAFRPLAGLTLAVFVAGFLAPLTSAVSAVETGRTDVVTMPVPAARAEAVAGRVRAELGAAGVVTVAADPDASAPAVPVRDGFVALTVAAPVPEHDRVRTVLDRAVPGTLALTPAESAQDVTVLGEDLGRGALVVLVATFLLAATAAGTTAAARVLDHRHVLYLQRLTGTPLAVLDRARRAETLAPLLANGAIALALGLLCASPFAPAGAALEPGGLVVFGGLLVAGTLIVLGATAASRPLLASVTAPGRERAR
ncbi:MAG: FtsX-like permease family protein, partial [Pseudonocardia sediminis]